MGGDGTAVLTGKARVVTQTGTDVTSQLINGANKVLDIARKQDVSAVYLKGGSPSCGIHETLGVTAALLLAHGYCLEEF